MATLLVLVCARKFELMVYMYLVIAKTNRIFDGIEAETRKSQASFQIIESYARLAEHKT